MAGALEGKVALVTGAVRRNGRAIAHALAREGASIVINTRRSRDEAEAVRAELEKAGAQALVCIADITDEAAVTRMFEAIGKRFGGVDILVNNAADRERVKFTEMTMAQWRHIVSIILDGAFLCSRAAIPHMLGRGWGRIVNIGGAGHRLPNYVGRAHAAAAKAGLEGLTRSLAMEYAQQGITVNCVSPGRIGGERSRTSGEVPSVEIPVGFEGVPDDIASTVCFICSPAARFITGQNIHVNGGQVLV
jgi:3-oxoacyl-[acyl-carrier protein] reductase